MCACVCMCVRECVRSKGDETRAVVGEDGTRGLAVVFS